MTPANTRRRINRNGATLLDVAAGSMLLAVMLIPSAHLISRSRSSNARLSARQTMIFEAENRMEATKIALSDSASFNRAWANPTETVSTVSVSDGPDLTLRTRVFADTTIAPTARLVTIEVMVWHDANRDGTADAGESSEQIRTQWAAP